MEPWPCSIFLVACAHLPVVVNCRLALRDVFPRFQRSTPVPKVDLWIFPTQLSWFCLCWMSSFASCNSRQSYVLKNCAYTCATFCVSCPLFWQASFCPFPLALKFLRRLHGLNMDWGRQGRSRKKCQTVWSSRTCHRLYMIAVYHGLSWFILLKRLVVVHTVWRSL